MIEILASLGKKEDPISKIMRAKKGWRHGSRSMAPA
jgi:hypothetical protein